jgi:Lipopolysaccharide-assembly
MQRMLLIGSAVVVTGLSGCGYNLGNVYGPEVRSISVPIFQNETFRRGIEYQLTEAVHKEIRTRTPFRLVTGDQADTRLTGRIVEIRKDVLGENRLDDPRELQVSLMVRVKWEDIRTGQVLAQQDVPLSSDETPLAVQSEFAPEVGQSLATATDDATKGMARRIVNMLESAW